MCVCYHIPYYFDILGIMNEQDIQQQLHEQQQALTKIYISVEKTRKYMLWSGIASLVFFILPLVIVMIMAPRIIGTVTSSMNLGSLEDVSTMVTKENMAQTLNTLKEIGGI